MFIFTAPWGKLLISDTATCILSTTAFHTLAIGSWKHSVALSAWARFEDVREYLHGLERHVLVCEVKYLLRICKGRVWKFMGWLNYVRCYQKANSFGVWVFIYMYNLKYCFNLFHKYKLANISLSIKPSFYLGNNPEAAEGVRQWCQPRYVKHCRVGKAGLKSLCYTKAKHLLAQLLSAPLVCGINWPLLPS